MNRRHLMGLFALAPLVAASSACTRRGPHDLVGTRLPELVLPDLAGQPNRLQDLAGQAILINVWATWCHPCRTEMAGLDRLYRGLHPQGLRLLGISVDEDINLVREYVRQAGVSFPILNDPKGTKTSAILGSSAVPMTLLLGRDGVVRRVVLGERAWDEGEARAWVGELVN